MSLIRIGDDDYLNPTAILWVLVRRNSAGEEDHVQLVGKRFAEALTLPHLHRDCFQQLTRITDSPVGFFVGLSNVTRFVYDSANKTGTITTVNGESATFMEDTIPVAALNGFLKSSARQREVRHKHGIGSPYQTR